MSSIAIQRVPFPELLPNLPADIDNLISPYHISVSKAASWMPPNSSFVWDVHVVLLEQAHRLVFTFQYYLSFAQLNKAHRDSFNLDKKPKLFEEIKSVFSRLNQVNNGFKVARCIRECVDSGTYLAALKVCFYANPSALENKASDPNQDINEGFSRNILHNAVAPNNLEISSLSFISSVLLINKSNNLGLLGKKDCYGWLPLHRACNYMVKENKEKVLKKLLEEDPDVKDHVNVLVFPQMSSKKEKKVDYTPIYLLFDLYNGEDQLKLVQLLQKHGADIDQKNCNGDTTLQLLIADSTKMQHVPTLLRCGASALVSNKKGQIAMDAYIENSLSEFHKLILKANSYEYYQSNLDSNRSARQNIKNNCLEAVRLFLNQVEEIPQALLKRVVFNWMDPLVLSDFKEQIGALFNNSGKIQQGVDYCFPHISSAQDDAFL